MVSVFLVFDSIAPGVFSVVEQIVDPFDDIIDCFFVAIFDNAHADRQMLNDRKRFFANGPMNSLSEFDGPI